MTLDAGGNLIVGGTTPQFVASNRANITLAGTSEAILGFGIGGTSAGYLYHTGTNMDLYNGRNGYLGFSTNATERMRIDSSGNLIVGTPAAWFGRKIVCEGTVAGTSAIAGIVTDIGDFPVSCMSIPSVGNNQFVGFWTDSRAVPVFRGGIDYNRGAGLVRYNTTSDATLKNLIGDSDKQKSVDILSSTKIREYAWKDDLEQKPQIGVIAQELYETYKGAVVEGGEDAEGNYRPWAVDKTAFTFHLVAGWQEHQRIIQEQQAIINDLTTRLTALENK
jgi:hypothetical protein